jgi:dipeptidyl aminopeptidase/acylaminoacyl peptidase
MSRSLISVAVALVFLGALAQARVSAAAPEPRLHAFDSVEVSPDGTRLLSLEGNEAGPDDLRTPPMKIVVRSLETDRSTTLACAPHVECRLTSPTWSPDGTRIAYLEHVMKTSRSTVWTAAADGSGATPLLRDFKGVIGSLRWSPDGSTIAVLATANALKQTGATQAGVALVGDIAAVKKSDVQRIATVTTAGLRYVSPPDLFIYEYDWIPNGGGFVASASYGNGDDNWWIAKLYRIDAKTTSASVLYTPALQINAPRVSPDGKTVAFIGGIMSDFGSVGGDIFTVPLAGGSAADVTPDMPASANSISWQRRSDRITFTAFAGDAAALDTVDLAAKHIATLWSDRESISGDHDLRISFSRDGKTSAVVAQTFERPPEIYAGALGSWHAVTHANAAQTANTRAQSISWTNDGYQVQGWLLAPLNTTVNKRSPMIVEIHGGPSAAVTPRFLGQGVDRDLLARGYYLFLPNPRGSYGQGEKFTAANVKDFGYGDLRDIMTGVDAAEKAAPIDDARLGIGGGSYGGYMTMWALTQTQRFKAAYAAAGVADWLSYYGQNGIDQWMIPFFGASVYDDPAVYARSSPITYIKNVKTPTFIYVGERDVECPMAQSLEYWHALNTLGVPTSFVVYAGEGHGIRQPPHRKDVTRRTLAWFDRYLGTMKP